MKARSEYRILVVDDQKSMRGLATYFLKQIEFQDIDEAENAREALMKMQTKRYDLLLHLRAPGKQYRLYISANPSSPGSLTVEKRK